MSETIIKIIGTELGLAMEVGHTGGAGAGAVEETCPM